MEVKLTKATEEQKDRYYELLDKRINQLVENENVVTKPLYEITHFHRVQRTEGADIDGVFHVRNNGDTQIMGNHPPIKGRIWIVGKKGKVAALPEPMTAIEAHKEIDEMLALPAPKKTLIEKFTGLFLKNEHTSNI